MNKLTTITALASVLILSPAAQARHYGAGGSDRDTRDYAEVLSAAPIYRQVRVYQPRQECWDERVVHRSDRNLRNADGAAILGGIIGGVLGHQVGKGRGRDVATATGAVIGAGVAQRNALRGQDYASDRVSYETVCQKVDDYGHEERIDGYDVTYRYNGRIFHTRMPYDPGARIPVRVEVTPARY